MDYDKEIEQLKDKYFKIELLLGYLDEAYVELMEYYRPIIDDRRPKIPIQEIKDLDKKFNVLKHGLESLINNFEPV